MDHVCYTKIINGALNCGRVELAYSFYEKSLCDKITLNIHVYKALAEDVKNSKISEKVQLISNIEKTIEKCSNFVEIPRKSVQEKKFFNNFEGHNNEKVINRQISSDIDFEDHYNNSRQENIERNKPFEERKTQKIMINKENKTKENKINMNFRDRHDENVYGKNINSQNNAVNANTGKKTSNQFVNITQKELCSMVNPKNL